jgi:hypothetical protein
VCACYDWTKSATCWSGLCCVWVFAWRARAYIGLASTHTPPINNLDTHAHGQTNTKSSCSILYLGQMFCVFVCLATDCNECCQLLACLEALSCPCCSLLARYLLNTDLCRVYLGNACVRTHRLLCGKKMISCFFIACMHWSCS